LEGKLQLRSVEDVRSSFDVPARLVFHEVYRQHLLRTAADARSGRIVLSFTLTPNGFVKGLR
jgi:hypothetical protein